MARMIVGKGLPRIWVKHPRPISLFVGETKTAVKRPPLVLVKESGYRAIGLICDVHRVITLQEFVAGTVRPRRRRAGGGDVPTRIRPGCVAYAAFVGNTIDFARRAGPIDCHAVARSLD